MSSMATRRNRLLVVSNRLPFAVSRGRDGRWQLRPGSGGLVSALVPVLRHRGGLWIGWSGSVGRDAELDSALAEVSADAGYSLKAVPLTRDEVSRFYLGFSNELIWPLFHDLLPFCKFEPAYWQTYLRVNRKFAEVVARNAADTDLIWVHDYHLMELAAALKCLGVKSRTGFFLHIPFPSPDIFMKLPWRWELLEALLQYDLVGFQTARDRRNFLDCLRLLTRDVAVRGAGQVMSVKAGSRQLAVGHFPISIDFNGFVRDSMAPAVLRKAEAMRARLPERQLILGIDRLDYTKGIPERLRGFRLALQRYPELRERIMLIQVIVPSRERVPQYHELKGEIESLVGEINGEFTRPGGWVPIHYVFRSLPRDDLLAYYRAADIALVTPVKDGMNLVAKEFVACSTDDRGVLILSEFAGAAAQLGRSALLVNPHDVEGIATAISQAAKMPEQEREDRMRRMRRSIRRQDVFWWVDNFLRAAIRQDLDAFLPAELPTSGAEVVPLSLGR